MNEVGVGDAAPRARDADIARHLEYLQVERRVAARTLALYGDAFDRLERLAAVIALPLREAKTHHVRRFAAQLHAGGLGPRSIALVLSAWRGFYRWLGRAGAVDANPVDGVRAPRAPQPLPKALSVDHAVALVAHRDDDNVDHRLAARDACIAELLYGCGLRVGELVGLDVVASGGAAGWIDAGDASAHVLGKGRKRRAVPVGAPALAALAD
ncbi:MAG: site-specific integrase, partial [Polyangia bacterium]